MIELRLEELDYEIYDKIYVVSDIHGNYSCWEMMMKEFTVEKNDLLIIIGDSCDRGLHSAKMYETYLEMMENGYNIVHLLGNHEEYFHRWYNDRNNEDLAEKWQRNGSKETLKSYDVFGERGKDLMAKHISWIETFPTILIIGTYIITHGQLIRKKMPLAHTLKDVIWNRRDVYENGEEMIDYYKGKTIVYGHTPTDTKMIEKFDDGRICIDCGCAYYNVLGAIELKSMKEYYVHDSDAPVGIYE